MHCLEILEVVEEGGLGAATGGVAGLLHTLSQPWRTAAEHAHLTNLRVRWNNIDIGNNHSLGLLLLNKAV